MSADLERQVDEMGTDYRAVVDRLRAAREIDARGEGGKRHERSAAGWLVAASLLTVFGLASIFYSRSSAPGHRLSNPSSPYGAREYRESVSEMIASQNPDGSWQNDFLTRRNASVLAKCGETAARVAYKKAMRNLRAKGIL